MKTDMNAISKQVVWICMVFEFLTERGQPAGKLSGRGQPMTEEVQNS